VLDGNRPFAHLRETILLATRPPNQSAHRPDYVDTATAGYWPGGSGRVAGRRERGPSSGRAGRRQPVGRL